MLLFFNTNESYILVDIDNTVTVPGLRLSKFTRARQCNYKKANSLIAIIQDIPIQGAGSRIGELANQSPVAWLSSRSIKQAIATYIWFIKNGFPIRISVFTGKMQRKIDFLELFLTKYKLSFIIDDIREGYEYGKPEYVELYKNYLEQKHISYHEKLFFD